MYIYIHICVLMLLLCVSSCPEKKKGEMVGQFMSTAPPRVQV